MRQSFEALPLVRTVSHALAQVAPPPRDAAEFAERERSPSHQATLGAADAGWPDAAPSNASSGGEGDDAWPRGEAWRGSEARRRAMSLAAAPIVRLPLRGASET